MLNYKHTLKGVSPPPLWHPDAITPELVLRHPRSALGWYREQGLSPQSSYQHPEFPINGKGITLQDPPRLFIMFA
jgi:hypothetical protein